MIPKDTYRHQHAWNAVSVLMTLAVEKKFEIGIQNFENLYKMAYMKNDKGGGSISVCPRKQVYTNLAQTHDPVLLYKENEKRIIPFLCDTTRGIFVFCQLQLLLLLFLNKFLEIFRIT